nr:MAG TPA: hypothetical protein [Caudoviricetes sp.]
MKFIRARPRKSPASIAPRSSSSQRRTLHGSSSRGSTFRSAAQIAGRSAKRHAPLRQTDSKLSINREKKNYVKSERTGCNL